MQHETQLRTALTRVLAQEHAVDEAAIRLTVEAEKGIISAQIADRSHEYPYLEALEKAFVWAYREVHPSAHGYYPVAHLHREDVI